MADEGEKFRAAESTVVAARRRRREEGRRREGILLLTLLLSGAGPLCRREILFLLLLKCKQVATTSKHTHKGNYCKECKDFIALRPKLSHLQTQK